jgi:ribosomal protein S30
MNEDSFTLNVEGVRQLIESDTNKAMPKNGGEEGVVSEYTDILDLPMTDEELIELRDQWVGKSNKYTPKIEARQKKNKIYYQGKQRANDAQVDRVVSSNLLFEAEETFIPQALSKNPEPVVWSDNTDEGKLASNDVKTMLQYHADVLCLRKKLGVMVRHWSIYFIGVVKHGWDEKSKDIKIEIRKPQNLILDPDGYIDEYGNYVGDFLGEKIESTAAKLIEENPKHKDYILLKVNGKLGTSIVRTEWWTDDYCFTTFEDKVLDKHKNQYFNYEGEDTKDEEGNVIQTATPAINHFSSPKMPYTFLSVFSLQEQPYDVTNLIEQNIANQDRINDRDDQIAKNLRNGNNSIALSGVSFNAETAEQAARALEDGDPVLVPDGQVESAIKRIPANNIPDSVFTAQENDRSTLRSIFGTAGLSPTDTSKSETARGQILDQNHDSTRIGGGIGDALEQVADNVFNWMLQLYCVFYDEPHYGAIMGNGRAVDYVQIINSNLTRKFVISVSPNSMKPKDEVSEQNLAVDRWNNKAIDPIGLMKALNEPDPMESAKRLVTWIVNPQLYAQTYFPEANPNQQVAGAGAPNPPGPSAEVAPEQNGSLAAPTAPSALSQVPINTPSAP